MNRITIVVIDEQAFFRAGVREALSQESDFNIIDCDPTQDCLGVIAFNHPDVVLLGCGLAILSGLELSRKIARYYPNTRVIILSPDPNDKELFETIKTATVACLSRKTTTEELVSTIRQACDGEYPTNESLTARPVVIGHILEQFQDLASAGKAIKRIARPLTQREMQILDYVASGNTNKQIGRILGISEQTVKNHISAIFPKLNANCRAHAVSLAIRNGWLSTEIRDGDMVAVS